MTKSLSIFERTICSILRCGSVPKHVAFIMDGNRRFARRKVMPCRKGHELGYETLENAILWCLELGVEVMTVYAFSIYNFKRATAEVDDLMELAFVKFEKMLAEAHMIHEKGVQVRVLGDLSLLPLKLQKVMCKVMQVSKNNVNMIANLCFAYTSTHEYRYASTIIQAGIESRMIDNNDVDDQVIERCLFTRDCPPCDLLLRTSGETRLSDFMLWQSRTAQIMFLETLWPELRLWDFFLVILKYQVSAPAQIQMRKTFEKFYLRCKNSASDRRINDFLSSERKKEDDRITQFAAAYSAQRQSTDKLNSTMPSILDIVKPGVLTGEETVQVFRFAQEHKFAIPAVNVTTSSSANAVLEAAKLNNSPVIIQVSNGGGQFYAGKSLGNKNQEASIAGSIALAHHVRIMASHYGVPVILHSDHCAKKLLPWFDGMLEANEKYFEQHGVPLFSSHMLDLSEESIEDNVAISKKYLERMHKINLLLEIELGITGGEEDGVDNTDVDNNSLYSQPEDIEFAYKELSPISHRFSVAAAFGNVHGVYKPGNVKLHPELLGTFQTHMQKVLSTEEKFPVMFVFHGGSGSTEKEIHDAVSHGVVKMNIDTDTQWAYWDGVRAYESKFHGYLQSQIGNPDGEDKPNKKQYDPRVWLRKAEESMVKRVTLAFETLNSKDSLALQ